MPVSWRYSAELDVPDRRLPATLVLEAGLRSAPSWRSDRVLSWDFRPRVQSSAHAWRDAWMITQAIEELGAAWPGLRATLDLGDAPLALVGGSVGAAVAASVLVHRSAWAGRFAVSHNDVGPNLKAAAEADGVAFHMV